METALEDRKERLALSTPAVKRALKAAAVRNNKLGVALGVAKPLQETSRKKATKPASKK